MKLSHKILVKNAIKLREESIYLDQRGRCDRSDVLYRKSEMALFLATVTDEIPERSLAARITLLLRGMKKVRRRNARGLPRERSKEEIERGNKIRDSR